MTKKQLAMKCNVAPCTIHTIEIYGRVPSTKVTIKLAKIFGVTTDYLLGLEGFENSAELKFALNALQKIDNPYRKLILHQLKWLINGKD
jgi:transcriptional regulator with XRE-family HTH domain